ncbi:hypothetical protein [Paenibacillus cremeus]|uniref:Uncharacterized protein n=1 Tax=Paenibacillus cremeus TaxID=2163881 RepID=A0A559JKA1_9BACL|nr:hypothetical protein [Paenibacillus cremeus]TVY00285.1 hypothetical protein FPZ49_33410 [Paenibacillus cremeus]
MARSQAKKQRMKLERQGQLNPELLRGDWNGVIPVERTTPTLQEKARRMEQKHKKKWNRMEGLPSDAYKSVAT